LSSSITYGLSHIALKVRDTQRTKQFYQTVFDMEVMYDEPGFLQMTTPGCNDILVFERKEDGSTGQTGGIAHFGFRLKHPGDITAILQKINKAGGAITGQGEFVKGSPYVFFKDPAGYELEVWYEVLAGDTV
jgi:predicted enzyme related to lactoylglutathione lyase